MNFVYNVDTKYLKNSKLLKLLKIKFQNDWILVFLKIMRFEDFYHIIT